MTLQPKPAGVSSAEKNGTATDAPGKKRDPTPPGVDSGNPRATPETLPTDAAAEPFASGHAAKTGSGGDECGGGAGCVRRAGAAKLRNAEIGSAGAIERATAMNETNNYIETINFMKS